MRREFVRLRDALEAHLKIEEEILYPKLLATESLKDLAVESRDEHAEIRTALKKAASSVEVPDLEDALVEVVHRARLHLEQEEQDLLPCLRKHLSIGELAAIGDEIEQRSPLPLEKRAA